MQMPEQTRNRRVVHPRVRGIDAATESWHVPRTTGRRFIHALGRGVVSAASSPWRSSLEHPRVRAVDVWRRLRAPSRVRVIRACAGYQIAAVRWLTPSWGSSARAQG